MEYDFGIRHCPQCGVAYGPYWEDDEGALPGVRAPGTAPGGGEDQEKAEDEAADHHRMRDL